jgi:GNAT superfamily N-acetyltransferase
MTAADGDLLANRRQFWRARWQQPLVPDAFGFVAVEGDALVGFAYALPVQDPDWGTLLDNLHVDPKRKRSGIGRRLLAAVAAHLGPHAAQPLHLWVLEGNQPARDFYARLGAEEVERAVCPPFGGVELPERRCMWRDPNRLIAP